MFQIGEQENESGLHQELERLSEDCRPDEMIEEIDREVHVARTSIHEKQEEDLDPHMIETGCRAGLDLQCLDDHRRLVPVEAGAQDRVPPNVAIPGLRCKHLQYGEDDHRRQLEILLKLQVVILVRHLAGLPHMCTQVGLHW